MEPEEYRELAVRAGLEASRMLREEYCSPRATRSLGGGSIAADLMAEELIVEYIRGEGLEARFVSEESGVIGEGEVTVILDPLDGSKNYSSCIPWASISIAFAPTLGGSMAKVFAGAVIPVFYGDPISFARGEGVYVGSETLADKGAAGSNIVFSYLDDPEVAVNVARVVRGLGRYKFRSMGSSSLEISYVAIGRAAGFIDLRPRLRNVDTAAAIGILMEAGGLAVDPKGDPIDSGIDTVRRLPPLIISRDRGFLEKVLVGLATSSTP